MTAVEAAPLSLSQSSLIKMEERKRPAHDSNDVAPAPKRQATATNGASKGSGDGDMGWKDDLERFQKDAIYRQMQEYKREKNTLESTLKDMRKKARDHDDHLRIIDQWLKQLIDEVKLLVNVDEDVDMDASEVPSSLLFPDQELFEKHLQSRAEDIRSLMSRIFKGTTTTNPEVATLQAKISQLLASEKEIKVELERLRGEVKDKDERLENAIMRYMLAEKKLDRAKSVTAAKLDNGMLMGANRAKSLEESGNKRDDGTTNGITDQSEELAELEQEVKKTQAVTEKQKEQISKLEEDNATLTSQVTELSTRSAVLSDDDYAKTELFKQLKAQHDDVVLRINNLEALNNELKDENKKLSTERSAHLSQIEAESRALVSEKDSLLAKAEADLARIRSNRDELLADREIKKASLDQEHEALRKIQELSSAQEDRIKALESENERLSTQSSSTMDTSELDSKNTEELRSGFQDLQKKYAQLMGELDSMQTAFQKTSRLANQKVTEYSALEEKVQRLAAEKSKADQKYFAAMKSKETRDIEVRTLRMQNSKSSEVVAQLKEAEAASRALVANLEKQLTEVKESLGLKVNENRTLAQQSTTQGLEVSRLNAQMTELKSQLTAKDTKLATTSSACRSAEVEVEELRSSLADTRKNLESWKGKSGQNEQYEALRMIAYCNICKKRLKNAVMTLCGHTFCFECIQERYDTRARKCPNCAKPYGKQDFMKITL